MGGQEHKHEQEHEITETQKKNEVDGGSSTDKIKHLQQKCKKGICMVRYHAKWCPHCVNMQSEWNKYNKQNGGHNIISFEEGAINRMENPPSVNGFPTIKLLHGGKEIAEFNEEKTAEKFKSFYENNKNNLNKDNIDEMIGGMRKFKLKNNKQKGGLRKNSKKSNKTNKKSNKTNRNSNKKTNKTNRKSNKKTNKK